MHKVVLMGDCLLVTTQIIDEIVYTCVQPTCFISYISIFHINLNCVLSCDNLCIVNISRNHR